MYPQLTYEGGGWTSCTSRGGRPMVEVGGADGLPAGICRRGRVANKTVHKPTLSRLEAREGGGRWGGRGVALGGGRHWGGGVALGGGRHWGGGRWHWKVVVGVWGSGYWMHGMVEVTRRVWKRGRGVEGRRDAWWWVGLAIDVVVVAACVVSVVVYAGWVVAVVMVCGGVVMVRRHRGGA